MLCSIQIFIKSLHSPIHWHNLIPVFPPLQHVLDKYNKRTALCTHHCPFSCHGVPRSLPRAAA